MQIYSGNNVIKAIASSILLSFGATTLAAGPNFQSILTKGQALGDGWVADGMSYHRRGPALAIGGNTRLATDPSIWTPAVYYRAPNTSTFEPIWRNSPPIQIGQDKTRYYSLEGDLHLGVDRVAFLSVETEYDSYWNYYTTRTNSTQVTTDGFELDSSQVRYSSPWWGDGGAYNQFGYSGHHLVVDDSVFSNAITTSGVGLRSPGYSLVMQGIMDEGTGIGSYVRGSRPDVDSGDFLVYSFEPNPSGTKIYRWHENSLNVWRDSPYSFRGSNSLHVASGGQMSRGRLIGPGYTTKEGSSEPDIRVFGEATATTFVPYAVFGEIIDGTSTKFAGFGSFIGEEGELLVYTAQVSDNPGVANSSEVLLGRRNGKSFVILERGQSMFGSTISSFYVREGSLYNNTITFAYDLADGRSGIAMMNVVPEPGTLAALGLGALLLRRRSRV